MKKDIRNRADIEQMVNLFYEKVRKDPLIGYIFNDVAKVNWEKHLPVMYNFWDNAIFFSGTYSGNPMELHKHLHKVAHLESRHFDRWNELFISTVDELFEGNNATLAKNRALSISTVMRLNINR